MELGCKNFIVVYFLFYLVFLSQTSSFLFTVYARSPTFKHLLSDLHLRWLPSVLIIAVQVITTLLLGNIIPLLESPIWLNANFVLLIDFYVRLYYNQFTQTSGGFEIASTIIVLLQRKRLTTLASHLRATHRCVWK